MFHEITAIIEPSFSLYCFIAFCIAGVRWLLIAGAWICTRSSIYHLQFYQIHILTRFPMHTVLITVSHRMVLKLSISTFLAYIYSPSIIVPSHLSLTTNPHHIFLPTFIELQSTLIPRLHQFIPLHALREISLSQMRSMRPRLQSILLPNRLCKTSTPS